MYLFKKGTGLLYMTAVACTLAFGLISCDDDELTAEEKAQKEAAEKEAAENEKDSKFWDVVGQLVGTLEYTEDYEGKTFEPVIGLQDPDDSQTRIVVTNSASLAAERYANLIGKDSGIDENTSSYSFEDESVGSLTYTKVTDGSAWATVDVDIKQIPHLTKIIYRSAEQGNTNASFEGIAYYRFGDVISRQREDGVEEYWICVRPSFGPEGKGDSHWATLDPLPDKNIWSYKASNGKTYKYPTGLGTSEEHMQNLAELLYAMSYPEKWYDNVTNHSQTGLFGPKGLPIFHDFHVENIKYHNRYFWQRVCDEWKTRGIDKRVLGMGMTSFFNCMWIDGISFLYKGYSWNTWTSNTPTLYQATFTNGEGVKSNMHVATYGKVQTQVIDKKDPSNDLKFDIVKLMNESEFKPSIVYPEYFGDKDEKHLRYVVRFATGKELGGGRYDPQVKIANCKDVYTYNSANGIDDLLDDPTITQAPGDNIDNPPTGAFLATDGMFYSTKSDCYGRGDHDEGPSKPLAVVIINDKKQVETEDIYDTGGTKLGWTGLAMALTDIKGEKWMGDRKDGNCKNSDLPDDVSGSLREILSGVADTKRLVEGCDHEHNHPAAKACQNYEVFVNDINMNGCKRTNWFIPSVGQWIMALEQLGAHYNRDFKWLDRDSTFNFTLDELNEVITLAGGPEAVFGKSLNQTSTEIPCTYLYATSTQTDDDGTEGKVWVLAGEWGGDKNAKMKFVKLDKYKVQANVRPFIAFYVHLFVVH